MTYCLKFAETIGLHEPGSCVYEEVTAKAAGCSVTLAIERAYAGDDGEPVRVEIDLGDGTAEELAEMLHRCVDAVRHNMGNANE